MDPQTYRADDGLVRTPPWVGHGAVGEVGVDAEVTVKMSLHWRTGLWLTPETQQQGSPLLKLPSHLRIYIVS